MPAIDRRSLVFKNKWLNAKELIFVPKKFPYEKIENVACHINETS